MKDEKRAAAGRKRAAVMRERLGEEVFTRWGRLGGMATVRKHRGEAGYFAELGRRGAAKRWAKEKGDGL